MLQYSVFCPEPKQGEDEQSLEDDLLPVPQVFVQVVHRPHCPQVPTTISESPGGRTTDISESIGLFCTFKSGALSS